MANLFEAGLTSLAGKLWDEHQALILQIEANKLKAQAFFDAYAAEVRKSSYGVAAKDFVVGMLRRAEDEGLYSPHFVVGMLRRAEDEGVYSPPAKEPRE